MSRRWVGLAGLLLLTGVADRLPADDATQAQAILETALRAHGGADRLGRTELMVRNATGTMSVFGQEIAFTDTWTMQLPDKWRMVLDSGPAGQKTQIVLVVNGDRGWQSSAGAVADVDKQRLGELREEAYTFWLATLLPLRRDKEFKLSPLNDAKVEGVPVAGLKVSRAGHADVKMYFDRQSGRLLKVEHAVPSGGLQVTKEYVYGEYKPFEGVWLPTKYVELVNSKKFTDVTSMSYRFPSRVELETFDKPK